MCLVVFVKSCDRPRPRDPVRRLIVRGPFYFLQGSRFRMRASRIKSPHQINKAVRMGRGGWRIRRRLSGSLDAPSRTDFLRSPYTNSSMATRSILSGANYGLPVTATSSEELLTQCFIVRFASEAHL